MLLNERNQVILCLNIKSRKYPETEAILGNFQPMDLNIQIFYVFTCSVGIPTIDAFTGADHNKNDLKPVQNT